MVELEIINKVADKNVDIDEYVNLVIKDEYIRGIIIENLLKNTQIMVYYHCYYIISKASKIQPDLFYEYWDEFANLLTHQNSYHRDIGLTILANLTSVDIENKFSDIYDQYISHFNDIKYMTAECFIKNVKTILTNKPNLTEHLINLLLDVDSICTYTDKQRALLNSYIIDILNSFLDTYPNKENVYNFVIKNKESISPKTRKAAKTFIKDHL